jgi:hypothetical protein
MSLVNSIVRPRFTSIIQPVSCQCASLPRVPTTRTHLTHLPTPTVHVFTQRQASSRSITVRLSTTVQGLGKKSQSARELLTRARAQSRGLNSRSSFGVSSDEFVQVNPGRMRHGLYPEGKAVYVPWKRRSQLNEMIAVSRGCTPLMGSEPRPARY